MELFSVTIDCCQDLINSLSNGGIKVDIRLVNGKLILTGSSNVILINKKTNDEIPTITQEKFIKPAIDTKSLLDDIKILNNGLIFISDKPSVTIKISHVYILQLEGGKYYVGYSENIEQRLTQHFRAEGAVYTKTYKPLCVLKRISDGTLEMEKTVTLEMMKKYGRENVRGGPWTSTNTSKYFPTNMTINSTPIVYCSDI